MAHIVTNPKVDAFIDRADKWQEAFESLRDIVLDCQLTETLKWGCPCYTYDNVNVVLMHGFKDYCALLFFKGSLLPDPHGLLVQQTENVQVGRQLRFTSASEVKKLKPAIRTYIQDAIQVEAQGLQPKYKKSEEFAVPEEFQVKLDKSAALRKAFQSLTPGRQRAYLPSFRISQTGENPRRPRGEIHPADHGRQRDRRLIRYNCKYTHTLTHTLL